MKIFKNKRGYEWWIIVMAISSLLVLVIFSVMYGGVFKGAKDSGADRICQMSAVANAYGKTPIIGTETFKLDCPMDTLTITMKDLKKQSKLAERKINQFNRDANEKNYAPSEYFNFDSNERSDSLLKQEWVLDKLVADELHRWWGNLGQGKLNGLFPNWWNFFGCKTTDEGGFESGCSGWEEFINTEFETPPTFCVVGTRIKFADDVIKEFGSNFKVDSINEWLLNNPIPFSDISYYEFLLDDSFKEFGLGALKNYSFDLSEPQAIVFLKINNHALKSMSDGAFKHFTENPLLATGSILIARVNLLAGAASFLATGGAGEMSKASDSFSTILIVPLSELENVCTVVTN